MKSLCFPKWEVYTPTADEIECYKKLLKEMTKLKRIEKLEAELAELKKEVKFKPYLAWVSDVFSRPNSDECPIALIVSKRGFTGFRFCDNAGSFWKYATPLTREEILSYLPPARTKYDWDAILKEFPKAQVAARHFNGQIVISTHSRIMAYDNYFISVSNDGQFFVKHKPEWILDKDCDWKDSIEYRRDVQ